MNTTTFAGFSKDAVAFLKNLEANNTRAWFNANKKIYETEIKKPASIFSEAMAVCLHDLTDRTHSAKIFRIHRDIRFAKDKTPYNTHLHIAFTPASDLPSPPCWFFGLDTERLTVGAGVFAFDKPALEKFRGKLLGPEGSKLAKLLQQLEARDVRLSQAELKRVPQGYPKDHPKAEHLRRKGLSAWVDLGGPDMANRDDLVAICRTSFKRMQPIFDWLIA